MNQYDMVRLEDLIERSQVRGETLTPEEQRRLDRLSACEQAERDAERPAWGWEGGHPDMF